MRLPVTSLPVTQSVKAHATSHRKRLLGQPDLRTDRLNVQRSQLVDNLVGWSPLLMGDGLVQPLLDAMRCIL